MSFFCLGIQSSFKCLSLLFHDLDNFEKFKSGTLKSRMSLNLNFSDIFSWMDESYGFGGRIKFKWGRPYHFLSGGTLTAWLSTSDVNLVIQWKWVSPLSSYSFSFAIFLKSEAPSQTTFKGKNINLYLFKGRVSKKL